MVQAELQVSLVECHLLSIQVKLARTDFSSPALPTACVLLTLRDESQGYLSRRVPQGRMTLKTEVVESR